MTRLRCDGATLRDVTALVEAHDQIRHFTRKTTCRLLSRMGIVQTRRLLQVMEADIKAQAPATVGGKMEQLLEGYARVDAVLTAGACFTKRDMALKGGDLLAMGLRPASCWGRCWTGCFRRCWMGRWKTTEMRCWPGHGS